MKHYMVLRAKPHEHGYLDADGQDHVNTLPATEALERALENLREGDRWEPQGGPFWDGSTLCLLMVRES